MFHLCTQDLAGTHLCAAGPCCSGRRGVVADGQLEGFLARPLPHQRAGILHHRRPRLPPHLLLQAHQLFRNRSVGLLRSFVAISSRVSLMFICFFFLVTFISGGGLCFPVIKACVFGSSSKGGLQDDVPAAPRNEGTSGSSFRHYTKLIICAAGLQVAKNTNASQRFIPPLSHLFFCFF